MPILLELRRGIGEPEQVPLSVGQQLSVGRRGMWRIDGPKVLDIHGFFFFDGVTLFVMSETDAEPVLVNRQEISMEWTPVTGPCEISMGGVVLSFVGSLGKEDSGVTLARVPPPSRQEMADMDNAPTGNSGQTIARAEVRAPAIVRRADGRAPSQAQTRPPPARPSVPAAQDSRPSKPAYAEPPRQSHDLDGTSGVTHVRPETLERLAADHQEAIASEALRGPHGPPAAPSHATPRARPPQPSPIPQPPPSGGFTMVLPEGIAAPPPPRPMAAPPQAQAPDAGRKNEGSGATRFAPLEAPSTGSVDAQAMLSSGAAAVQRATLASGAHFASSGPPALYAHQTATPFDASGAVPQVPQPPQPAALPWHGHPGVPPPAPPPGAPGSQDATVLKLSFGARLRRDWAATSWPRKILVFLAPVLAWILLSDDPEDLPAKTTSTAKPTAGATATTAPSAPPTSPATTSAPASTLAIIPAPMPSATSTSKTTAPVATAKGPPSLERKAIDALSMGNDAEALKYYDELAKDHPENPNFKEAARILRKRHEQPLPK